MVLLGHCHGKTCHGIHPMLIFGIGDQGGNISVIIPNKIMVSIKQRTMIVRILSAVKPWQLYL